MTKEVFLIGAKDAPLLQDLLLRKGFTCIEVGVSEIATREFDNPQEKTVALSREKVFRFAVEQGKPEQLIIGFHATAVFDGIELENPQTPDELKRVLEKINGHIYRYCVCVAKGLIGSDRQINTFSSQFLTFFPEVKRLTEEEVLSFVEGASRRNEIARNGPACRPLVGGIRSLLEIPAFDVADYESSMERTLNGMFKDSGIEF